MKKTVVKVGDKVYFVHSSENQEATVIEVHKKDKVDLNVSDLDLRPYVREEVPYGEDHKNGTWHFIPNEGPEEITIKGDLKNE